MSLPYDTPKNEGATMLSQLLRSVGLEVLDEIGDEIEDMLFGRFKILGVISVLCLIGTIGYFIYTGLQGVPN